MLTFPTRAILTAALAVLRAFIKNPESARQFEPLLQELQELLDDLLDRNQAEPLAPGDMAD